MTETDKNLSTLFLLVIGLLIYDSLIGMDLSKKQKIVCSSFFFSIIFLWITFKTYQDSRKAYPKKSKAVFYIIGSFFLFIVVLNILAAVVSKTWNDYDAITSNSVTDKIKWSILIVAIIIHQTIKWRRNIQ